MTPQGDISELYRQLCYTGQNNEETRRKDHLIFKDCRKT